jgi:hypothetical protein
MLDFSKLQQKAGSYFKTIIYLFFLLITNN